MLTAEVTNPTSSVACWQVVGFLPLTSVQFVFTSPEKLILLSFLVRINTTFNPSRSTFKLKSVLTSAGRHWRKRTRRKLMIPLK